MAFSGVRRAALYLCAAVLLTGTAAGTVFLSQTTQVLIQQQDAASRDAETLTQRLAFLERCGLAVETESERQDTVRIPDPFPPIYEEYNRLQKEQQMDLKKLRGQELIRYRYDLPAGKGYEESTVTLLVFEGKIVGGDVCAKRLGGPQTGLVLDKSLSLQ